MDFSVTIKLEEMRSVTPTGALPIFKEYEQACRHYFDRGADFDELLNDALFGQMFSVLLENLTVEEREKLPPIERACPPFYFNIEELFKGFTGERYPFNGMLRINLSTYRDAWIMEGGGTVPSAGGVWKNAYIEKWTLDLKEAEAFEVNALNAIKDYALKAYRIWSWPLLNEELGKRHLIYGNRCYELLLATFVDHNWQWTYETFDMQVHEPEIVREWRENESRIENERKKSELGTRQIP